MSRSADALARELAELRRRLSGVERGRQMGLSSIVVDGEEVALTDGIAAGLNAEVQAAQALDAATSAQAKADGAVVTFYGDTADLSTAKVGDFWRKDNGDVFTWDGAEWQPITSPDVRAALDAASTAQATADGKVTTFYAAQASPPTAEAEGDLWFVTDLDNRLRRWDGSAWTDVRDAGIAQAQQAADAAQGAADAAQGAADAAQGTANTALSTANGKNAVKWSSAAPSNDVLTGDEKDGDLWFRRDANGQTIGLWEFSGGGWVRRDLTDEVIAFLTASKIVTGELQAGARIIAGPEVGNHAEMTDSGFKVYIEDPLDGVPNEVVRMGTDGDTFAVQDPTTGNTLASISQDGVGSFQKVYSLTDPELGGAPLLGAFADYQSPTEQQDANPGLLDKLPRGIVAYGVAKPGLIAAGTTKGLIELSFLAQPGRAYRFHYSGNMFNFGASTAGANSGLYFRLVLPAYTADGSGEAPTPTLSNGAVFAYQYVLPYTSARNVTLPARDVLWRCNPGGTSVGGELNAGICKILIVAVAQVDMTLQSSEDMQIWVEDIGPDVPYTSIANTSTSSAPQPTQPTVKTYTTTWTSTSSATYKGSGAKRTDTSDVVQGYNSYNGDGEGLWIFPSMTSALSGATVKKVEVYAYANHWYYNSGGTALIKVHGYTSAPASSPSMTTAISSASWPKPGGRWVTLPSSLYAGFKSGSYRGFGMGPAGSTSLTYYGRFNGGTGAKIRITYVK